MTPLAEGPRSVSAAGVGARAVPQEPEVVRAGFRDELGFRLALTGVLLSCFAGHWSDMGVPVPVDRVLLLAGLAIEWDRARRARRLPRITTAGGLLVAATAWTTISFVGSPVRTDAGFFFLLDLYAVPALLFISAPLLFGTRRRRTVLAAAFTVFGLYLGFTAITQTLQLTPLVFPGYILDPSVGIHADRARGPYAEAVGNGLMLVISGVLAGYTASTASSRTWRRLGVLAALLCGAGCALTLTRAIWFAGGAALLIGLVLVPGLRRRTPLVLVGLVIGAVVFLAAFPDFLTAATDRGTSQSPIWDRLNVNAGAARMIWRYPLLGVGWNQAGLRMAEFVRLGGDYPVTAASATLIPHNVYLSRFAELGIVGGALWLAALVAVVSPVFRRSLPGFGAWRVALLAVAVCWLLVASFGPLNYSEPSYLLYLVGGVASLGLAHPPRPWDWRPRNRTARHA